MLSPHLFPLLSLLFLFLSLSFSALASPGAGPDGAAALTAPRVENLSPFFPGLPIHLPDQQLALAAAQNATTTPAPTPANSLDHARAARDLQKRAGTTCPKSYSACSALGAPGLCCRHNTNCAVDMAGHVACCPVNADCTGSIGGVTATASGTTAITTASSSSLSFVFASSTGATSTQGFIIVASTTVATPNAAAGRKGQVPFGGWFW